MDERFIKWLNLYDEFVEGTALRDIFNDAIRCYRNGIARPALMLSYIAFMQAVRNNLLNSDMPEGFKEGRWNAAMKDLRSDTKWEEQVLACVRKRTSGEEDPVFFNISDTLRDDVGYWKSRRNDCAHYKSTTISLSHVSAFWMFMMDNYKEFAPLGSLTQSINDYKRHYNLSLTPKGAATDRIFKRLCLVIKTKDNLKVFLQNTMSEMQDEQLLLLHQLLLTNQHRAIVIDLLKEKMNRIRMYLHAFPSDVSLVLGDDSENIRKFWYDDFQLSARGLNVYAEMLRANMIPKEEIRESLLLFLKNSYTHNSLYIENEDDFKVLLDCGLYDIFINEFLSIGFVCSNPGTKCYKTGFYIPIIKRGGITENLVVTLKDSMEDSFPYTLRARLKDEIFSVEANKQKYIELIDKLKYDDFLKLRKK